MKFRRITAIVLILLMLLGLIPAAFAAVGTGWNDDCRGNVKQNVTGVAEYGKHNWVKQ